MFDIAFDDTARALPDGVEGHTWATIQIEDFHERLVIPTEYWTRVDYYAQWYEACSSILADVSPAVFLVDVKGDWPQMNLSFSWVIYAEHGVLYVQNVMLFPNRFPSAGFANACLAVPSRETHSSEPDTQGMRISEWHTTRRSIAEFAERLQRRIHAGPGPAQNVDRPPVCSEEGVNENGSGE